MFIALAGGTAHADTNKSIGLTLTNDQEPKLINTDNYYYFEDPDTRYTALEILNRYKQIRENGSYAPSPKLKRNITNPFWLVVPIKNTTNHSNWYIQFSDLAQGRRGLIKHLFIYDPSKRQILLNGLKFDFNKGLHTKGDNIPIDLKAYTQKDLLFYIVPENYKKLSLDIYISPEKETPFNLQSILFDNISTISIVSIALILIAFLVTNGVGYLPILFYYITVSLWYIFIEQAVYTPFVSLLSIAPIIPALIALIFSASALFTVPQRYSNEQLRTLLHIAVFANITVIIAHSLVDFDQFISAYSLSLILSTATNIVIILFLHNNKSILLKPTTFCLSLWVGFYLLSQLVDLLFSSSILANSWFLIHLDKLSLYPQAIVLFAGIILSIKGDIKNQINQIAVQKQKAQELLKARKNKNTVDHSRLLRVIEREREIMEELRARESERTEEMRRAKITADEANDAKSAFLAVVSHEIRTPMTGIMGIVKLLEDTDLSQEQKDYLLTVKDSGDAMMALLNDILDFSKIEDGSMKLETIEFDLRRTLNGVSMLMKAHADQKNIDLVVDIDNNLPSSLYGDPTRLKQVILNLVGNAIKFTEKGFIRIAASVHTDDDTPQNNNATFIKFIVQDTGLGISEEGQNNLFKPFSQADDSIARKFGGTGLGLTICKTLVDAMGGQISLSSKLNVGTTFTFTLPFALSPQSLGSGKIQDDTPSLDKITDKNILAIDDNEVNRKVIDGFLKKLSHKPLLAESGQEALDLLSQNNNIDLMLVDIEMPGMTGIDFAAHVFNNDKYAKIPMIAVTGNIAEEDILKYKAVGFIDHLPKPIDIDRLSENINTALSNQPVEHEAPEVTLEKVKMVAKEKDTKTEEKVEKEEPKAVKPVISKTLDEQALKGLKDGLGSQQTADLIKDLFNTARDIWNQLVALKFTKDKNAARLRAHELHGMTGNFGLKALSDKAREIEIIAKDEERQFEDLIPHIDDLSTLMERSKYAVQEFLDIDLEISDEE